MSPQTEGQKAHAERMNKPLKLNILAASIRVAMMRMMAREKIKGEDK